MAEFELVLKDYKRKIWKQDFDRIDDLDDLLKDLKHKFRGLR